MARKLEGGVTRGAALRLPPVRGREGAGDDVYPNAITTPGNAIFTRGSGLLYLSLVGASSGLALAG